MKDKPLRGQMTPQQKQWIRMTIAHASREEILREIFGVELHGGDARKINNADANMCRWKKHPQYEKEWQKAWREAWGELTYEAMSVFREGMRDAQLPWRRTQSAVQAMTYGQKNLVGDDATSIKVQVTGMPDLGSPDQDEGEE